MIATLKMIRELFLILFFLNIFFTNTSYATDCSLIFYANDLVSGNDNVVQFSITREPIGKTGQYRSEVNFETIKEMDTAEMEGVQKCGNWCWAASAQVLLKYLGIRASQEDIVQKTKGALVDEGANMVEVMNSLNGFMTSSGKVSTALKTLPATFDTMSSHIKETGRPYVASIRAYSNLVTRELSDVNAHSIVVVGLTYDLAPGNIILPRTVEYYDPNKNTNRLRSKMSWNEFARRATHVFTVSLK